MLLDVMRECNNFFQISSESGEFKIENGSIKVGGKYLAGQYIAISGSILNDGVYRIENIDGDTISFVINNADYPAWVQPTGAHDAYQTGDRVTHNNDRWISLINANIWAPGSDPRWWDKLHDSPEEHLTVDEEFEGTIYGLRVPNDFLALAGDIAKFVEKQGVPTNIIFESFDKYSYNLASVQRGKTAAPAGWQDIFKNKLDRFRKMFREVEI